MDRDFLKEVFKETNAHLRATEQKSMIVTGVFVGFSLNGFVAVLRGQGIMASQSLDVRIVIAFHLLLLFVGSVVYIMQLWYRKWKEHYICVCREICRELRSSSSSDTPLLSEKTLPFWLRSPRQSKWQVSYDNLVHYVTMFVNLGVLSTIISDINGYEELRPFAPYLTAVMIPLYGLFIYDTYRRILKMDLGDNSSGT